MIHQIDTHPLRGYCSLLQLLSNGVEKYLINTLDELVRDSVWRSIESTSNLDRWSTMNICIKRDMK